MKIMVIHGQYPSAEVELRRKHMLAIAFPGTEIEFAEIKGDIWYHDGGNGCQHGVVKRS